MNTDNNYQTPGFEPADPSTASSTASTAASMASDPTGTVRDAALTAADKVDAVDVEAGVDSASSQAHDAIDNVAMRVTPALQRVKSGLSAAATSIATGADKLNVLQQDGLDQARTRIRTSPLMSVALAFALGMLLSGRRGR